MRHLAHSGRWLRSRFIRGGLILAYHRISAVDWDPFSLCVSPEHFAEHLAVLRSHASPLRLADLVQALDTGRIPYAATALTFDDGYVDNLSVAKPLLVQHGAAATVFVATGHRGSEFWWDTLARLLAPGQELPATVRIAVGDRIHTWKSPPAGDVNGRRRLLFSIHRLMQPLSPPLIQPILHSLSAAVSPMSTPAPFSRALTTDEVTELARGDLVDIGAHGDTHSLLAQLPVASQQSDIRQSKTVLESLLGRPILGFAYPYGSVSPATLNIVRGSGFAFACSSHTDVTSAGSNRFLLPRFWIPNWDGRRFLGWLMRWLKK